MEQVRGRKNGDTARMLAEFHSALGIPFGKPGLGSAALRKRLHVEENQELLEELDTENLVGIAQELADVVYVAYGTAHTYGIPLDEVIEAVHAANMTKFLPDGKPVLRADGKLLKSAQWFVPADIAAVLARKTPRGTSNRNVRGSTKSRAARRLFLLNEFGDGVRTPCYRCGVLLNYDTMTVDRIIPGCEGGTYRRNNIRPACAPCNSETGGALATRNKAS